MRMILTIAFALTAFSALADPSHQQPAEHCHVSDHAGFHCHDTRLGADSTDTQTDKNITE
jgi:hypothetical protein